MLDYDVDRDGNEGEEWADDLEDEVEHRDQMSFTDWLDQILPPEEEDAFVREQRRRRRIGAIRACYGPG